MSNTADPTAATASARMKGLPGIISSPGREHLRRLLRVRCLLLTLVVAAALVVNFLLGLDLPLPALAAIVATLLVLTAGSGLRLKRHRQPVSDTELSGQLTLDVMSLAVLLYFTGGWTNPLVSLFLVPIAVAVVVLPRPHAWGITLLTIIAYSLLTLFYQPVVAVDHAVEHSFTLHVAGMWLTFVLSAMLITYFGSSMVATLRQRERALAAEREENLRNEQIMGVATLAAGTAHELSTPLASIAVIAGELADNAAPDQQEDLRLLLDQVRVCRETLARLRDTAGGTTPLHPQPVGQFMEELRQRLLLLRPRARLELELPDTSTLPRIDPEPTLQQALLNLLDNAAAAASAQVDCRLACRDDWLCIDILDDGPGFKPRPDLSSTTEAAAQGLGMGLMLANATIERLGGQVSVHDRRDATSGGHVSVRLPLSRLQGGTDG